jgi:hypothetical protein
MELGHARYLAAWHRRGTLSTLGTPFSITPSGFIDAQDFEIIKRVSLVFAKADFDYFDVTGKGRVTQKEFITTPSQFFAVFDKKNTCRVTEDDIRQATAPPTPSPTSRHGGGRGGALLR